MNFQRPMQVVTPTLDGDVLTVLARGRAEFTGREVHRLIGHSSEQGVRRCLGRLVRQGIVHSHPAGRARLYQLNREHLAARWLEGLADLRAQLVDQLREELNAWDVRPVTALVFGSVARGEATAGSDLDVLLVRPADRDPDEEAWRDQVARLESMATAWTGNDTRVLEFGADELDSVSLGAEPVIGDALNEGVELIGSRRDLRNMLRNE